MSKLTKNIVANYLGRGWAVLSVYLFIPFYIQMLGIEAYGVVGFYSMLFGVFSFANVGLTATLSRELARLTGESDSLFEMRDLTRTLELVFRGIAVGVAAIVVLLAPLIA